MAQAALKAAKKAPISSISASYIAPVSVRLGPTHPSRYQTHYEQTLQPDLQILTFQHRPQNYIPPSAPKRAMHDVENDPYAVNRPPPRPKGNKPLRPLSNSHLIPQLSRVQIHIMSKEALTSKASLLAAIFALRAITGETKSGGGHTTSKGVEVVRARANLANWKIRRGIPCGVKVTLRGQKMFDFLESLTEFVLPRLRGHHHPFQGLVMPAPSANANSASMTAGVVSVGFGPEAMELFPQIEVNLDLYPRVFGFHVHFITNQRGKGAQNRARALVSGFQIPFIRK